MTKELMRKVSGWAVPRLNGHVPSQDIDDIIQETLILVDKNYKTDAGAKVETYAYRALMIQIALYLRKNKKHSVLISMNQVVGENDEGTKLTIEDYLPSEAPNPVAVFEQKQQLENAMSSLTDKEKNLINLYHIQGYSMQELAEMYSINKMLISRKLSAIMEKMQRENKNKT